MSVGEVLATALSFTGLWEPVFVWLFLVAHCPTCLAQPKDCGEREVMTSSSQLLPWQTDISGSDYQCWNHVIWEIKKLLI